VAMISADPELLWVSAVDHRGVLLVFLATFLVELAASVLRWRENRLTPREQELLAQHGDLVRQEKKLDACSNFVARSQVQRKAVKIEKEMDAIKAARAPAAGSGGLLFTVLRPAATVACAWLWWGVPLVQFRPVRMWPISRMFALPNLPAGAVGVMAWSLTCRRVITSVPFFSGS
jgi:hypothetical protein